MSTPAPLCAVTLSMWIVYDHPKDYPAHFVARRWMILPAEALATADFFFAETLEGVRELLPPGLHRLPRAHGDEPVVAEVWL